MTSEPLDYEGLIELAGENKWDKIPLKTIIGHIHLHVGDLDAARKFYTEGLGFDLVMEAGTSAIFFSSGGYHHHIGLNVWNGRNAEPQADNEVGMKYYSITFPDGESRESIVKNLINLGYEVIKEDKDIYTKDPSKNLIKLKV